MIALDPSASLRSSSGVCYYFHGFDMTSPLHRAMILFPNYGITNLPNSTITV